MASSKQLAELSPQQKRELLARLLREREAGSKPVLVPMSLGQRTLWFHHEIAPDSLAYNIVSATRLRPDVDLAALRAALQALVDRHAILRTTYASAQGGPVQHVHPSYAADLELVDGPGLDDAALRERVFGGARRPFDLRTGPVFRATLYRGAQTGPVLAFVFHHIALDFRSLDILGIELDLLYARAVRGERAVLPAPAPQFADYVRWQAEMLAGPEGERLWSYWRERFKTEPPPLVLPLDRPRSPMQTYGGAAVRAILDGPLIAQLRGFAAGEGTTLYTVVLAAFQVLLSRHSGQDDVTVGSPMLGSQRPELEGVAGYLSNPVPLRGDLSGDPSFRSYLAQARDTVLDAIAHQEFPFALLVERLRPHRDPSRSPLYQAALFWDKPLRPESDPSRLWREPFASGQLGAPFELTLTVIEAPGALELFWLYNVDLFEASTIERMAGHFRVLLDAALTDPDRPVSRLPLLTAEERAARWRAPGGEIASEGGEVHRQIERQAARRPDALAVACGEQTATYAELDRQATRIARALVERGIGPGAVVGILLDRSIAMVAAMVGIWKAGAGYLPLDPTHPQDRLAFVLQDSGARLVLTRAAVQSSACERANVPALDVDVCLAGEHAAVTAVDASPGDTAYVIYTSGSTGRPKGVQVSRGAAGSFLRAIQRELQATPADVFLAVTTIAFDIAVLELLLPLTVGAQVIVVPREVAMDGERLADMLRTTGAAVVQATPATWQLLLDAGWEGDPRLTALCGGEALRWDLAAKLVERTGALWNLYGPTEATVWCSVHRVGTRRGATVPIGRPLANSRLYVLDAGLEPVPAGVPGELFIAGGGVAQGYVGLPELTAGKFIPEPHGAPGARMFRTGDRVRMLPDGELEFLGRIDQQIKLGGHRIEPGEIEAVLVSHPGVHSAVVVLRDDPRGRSRLVAYIVPEGAGSRVDRPAATPPAGPEDAPTRASQPEPDPAGDAQYRLPNGAAVVHHDAYQTNAVFKEVFEDRIYLKHGIQIGEGDCVFDVGANIGLFTLFAHAQSKGVRIYAFEPLPPNFERLRTNVALNGVDATVFGYGLAERAGRADFTFYPRLAALSGRFPDGDPEVVRSIMASWLRDAPATHGLTLTAEDELDAASNYLTSEIYSCELRTLSDVIEDHGIERIDLLKIDAEKSELEILHGLKEEHWSRVRQIVMEVHTEPLLDAVVELIERHGLVVTWERTVVVVHGSQFIYMLYATREAKPLVDTPASAVPEHELPSAGELRRFLAGKLPEYMIPSMFVEIDALPVTANGKLERNALPAPAWAEPALAAAFEPPRPGVESALAAIWSEVLGVARVGAHDNFFHLGGASIATLRLAELARAADLRITPEMVFRHQVLRELAEAIAEAPSIAPELRGDPAVGRGPAPSAQREPGETSGVAPSGAVRAARVVIESLGVYLPSRRVSTEEVLRGCDQAMEFPLQRMTGIRERPVAADGEFSIDLAAQAVTRCLALSRHHPADIDLLICCNISRYDAADSFSFEPSTAATLRARFGLSNALAFDIGNACAGMFTAINLVDALIQGDVVRRAMVVSGEYITHLTRTAQREIEGFMDPRLACLTLGDAAVALVLERSTTGTGGFQDIELYTLGRHAQLCIAKATDRPHGGAIMLTDAIRQTAVGVKNAVAHARYTLARAQQPPESCKQVIMHQTSETAIREAMREINRVYGRAVCDDQNTIINLARRGNTATTTHFVTLHDQFQDRKLRRGDRVLFGISGSGQTIGTAIYDLDDLPERVIADPPAAAPRPAPARRVIPRHTARPRRVRVESIGTLGAVPTVDRTALDMATAAARAGLAGSKYGRGDIDLLLYTGIYRDEFLSEPALAAMIAGALEMNDDAPPDGKKTLTFDVLNGQLGFLNACWVASEAILAGKFRTAMVLAAEIENNRAAPPHPLLGLRETAGAVILDIAEDPRRGFGRFVFRYWTDEPRAFASRGRFAAGTPFLQFERRPDLEQRYVSCITDAVRELLSIEHLTLDDIAAILPPQSSPSLIDALAARLEIERARCIDVSGGGDLFTSSLPYALEAAPRAGVRPGDAAIVISAGSGGQVGCALYYF